MTDAERLREIAGDISATNNAEDASRAAALWDIADRLEKREAERPEKACAHEFYSTAFSKGQAYCIHCGKEAERE